MENNIKFEGFESKKMFEIAKVITAAGFGCFAGVDAKVATGIYESEMKPLYKIIGCTVFTWKTWVNLQNLRKTLEITYEQAQKSAKKKAEPETNEDTDMEEPYTEEVTEPEYSTDDSDASPEPQE